MTGPTLFPMARKPQSITKITAGWRYKARPRGSEIVGWIEIQAEGSKDVCLISLLVTKRRRRMCFLF